MGHIIKLNNDEVEVEYTAYPFIPGYTAGAPENCYPDEGGEIEIEEIIYTSHGYAMVNDQWVKCLVKVDVSSILSDYDQEQLMDEIDRRERSSDDYYE